MKTPGWYSDPQWARAIGAVTLAAVAVYGVSRAGGPVAVAREAEPVARVVAEVWCAASSVLRQEGTAQLGGLRLDR
jgi:hypothetical protein